MDRELAVGRIYRCYTGEFYIVDTYENGMVGYTNLKTGIKLSEPIETFLGKKVPDNVDSKQEYQFERADIIHQITGIQGAKLELAVLKNDGYCPCKTVKNADTKCKCKEFREAMEDCTCHCGLYRKTWLGDQM